MKIYANDKRTFGITLWLTPRIITLDIGKRTIEVRF